MAKASRKLCHRAADREIAERLATYEPACIDPREWRAVRPFVLECAGRTDLTGWASTTRILRVLAPLSAWAMEERMTLDPELVFDPDTVERFVTDGLSSDLCVPRTPSGWLHLDCLGSASSAMIARGAVVPLPGLQSDPLVALAPEEGDRRAGGRDRHAAPRGRRAPPSDRPSCAQAKRPGSVRRAEPAVVPSPSRSLLRPARDAPALASGSGSAQVDLSPRPKRSTGGSGGHCPDRPAAGQGEPLLGLPADPR